MRHVVGVGNQLKTKRRPRSDCVQLFVKLGKNKPEPPNDESGSNTSQRPVRLGKSVFYDPECLGLLWQHASLPVKAMLRNGPSC